MLSYTDLKKGTIFIYKNNPYIVLEYNLIKRAGGQAVVKVKIKNLISGEFLTQTFHASDEFEEAEIEKTDAEFIYSHRGRYVFCEKGNKANRFELDENIIGDAKKFLKTGMDVKAIKFNNNIVGVELPIKVQLKVVSAPPGIKGDRAQGGTKQVEIETGATINVPLFVEEGDVIEINTETGEYIRRV